MDGYSGSLLVGAISPTLATTPPVSVVHSPLHQAVVCLSHASYDVTLLAVEKKGCQKDSHQLTLFRTTP